MLTSMKPLSILQNSILPEQSAFKGRPVSENGNMSSFQDTDSAPTTPTSYSSSFPAYGVRAETGRRSTMEDAHSICPSISYVWPPDHNDAAAERLPPCSTSDLDFSMVSSPPHSSPTNNATFNCSDDTSSCTDNAWQDLHYFGVFDGHAGSEVSQHCASRLQHHIRQALNTAFSSPGATCFIELKGSMINACAENDASVSSLSSYGSGPSTPEARQDIYGRSPTFSELVPLDEKIAGLRLQACNNSITKHGIATKLDGASLYSAMDSAIYSAFVTTDHEISTTCSGASLMGSTAVVALVGRSHIWAANCGDSRAVLCRSGQAIQLTDDHKPSRPDEAARITRAGGQITNNHGQRVQGVLAMTRAMGDHALRPYVISDPEVTYVARRADDELLLMASDGLWDVLSNQEAVTLALRCLQSAQAKGATRSSAARIAARVLTRAAIDSGSKDNVTVLVVDLAAGGDS